MPDQGKLAVGQLRRQVRLGTEAVYRIRDWDDTTVRVEVVRAPGLLSGQVFRLDRGAVLGMSLAEAGHVRPASPG